MTIEEWTKKLEQEIKQLEFDNKYRKLAYLKLQCQKIMLLSLKKIYCVFPTCSASIILLYIQKQYHVTPFIMDEKEKILLDLINPVAQFFFSNYKGNYESIAENVFWTFLYLFGVQKIGKLFKFMINYLGIDSYDSLLDAKIEYLKDVEYYSYDVNYRKELLKLKKENRILLQTDEKESSYDKII